MILLRWNPGSHAFEVPAGERLMDVLDDHPELGTALPMACRAANCGTCLVRVVAGSATIVAPDEWECGVLERIDAAPNERLGCQVCFAKNEHATQETEQDSNATQVEIERAL